MRQDVRTALPCTLARSIRSDSVPVPTRPDPTRRPDSMQIGLALLCVVRTVEAHAKRHPACLQGAL
eukprot:1038021-Pyramimonas_sp.AAC.1